ncbi:hypothetical protein Bra3105_03575 [Brachybacterium halotolerans subsp. kimchii]|uniref:hypothetical protein n=1 Tax=Brachybacterium halotolerans TaxID=2795215 RepID=UPI001E3A04A3|nr:hypothetical protein [Brachybacterium halotolerans]UEJ83409.1 hypothetical protein Bra3105_03575 [Brachybacterium halotolerans subsp. kimchii]
MTASRADAGEPGETPTGATRAVSGALRRTNHAGRSVTLAEGVAVAGGAAIVLAARGLRADALAVAAVGGLGLADDVLEPWLRSRGITPTKGLRGHLGALRRGRLTTGAAKALGIPVVCLLDAAAARARTASGVGPHTGAHALPPGAGDLAGALADAGVAAGAANLANLLDLRPGRALKATTACALVLAVPPARSPRAQEGRTLAVIAALAGLAALPGDLAERGMLGDTGANALGALVGAAAARRLPAGPRLLVLGGLGALTLASERVSFSAVIDATPALRRLDRWGRRAAVPAGAGDEGSTGS